jgi:hypothetical protein
MSKTDEYNRIKKMLVLAKSVRRQSDTCNTTIKKFDAMELSRLVLQHFGEDVIPEGKA